MNIEDMIDILAIDLLGVVPDDETIVISTNKGVPAVTDEKSLAGRAYINITKRIIGDEVPFLQLENDEGFVTKLKKIFGLGK